MRIIFICFLLRLYIQVWVLVRHIQLSQNIYDLINDEFSFYRTIASRKTSFHFNQQWASKFRFLTPHHGNNHFLHLRHCTVNFIFSSTRKCGQVTSSSPLQRPTNILSYVTNFHRVRRCGCFWCPDHRTHAQANAKGC